MITWCSLVYGLALLGGGLATQWHAWYLAIIFVVAIFAGSVMTLAWGLLFKLMPPDERGAISGLATTTKGIGLIFGTLLAGVLIDVLAAVPAGDRRLPGALADPGRADPPRGAARVLADRRRGGRERLGDIHS